tara:strand:- start:224 stop:610 length:387 start_codon:yes stop_codon:yes gene_type:complete
MTKNFSISEFECKGGNCKMTADVKNNVFKLAEQLQILRDKVKKPIKINSAFRCANYNDNVIKGAKHSQHKLGKAADIVVSGMTPNDVHKLVCEMVELGQLNFGGIGKYNTFTHLDIRDKESRWDYTKK